LGGDERMKKIIFGLMLLLIITTVSALTISGDSTFSMCQCETVRENYEVCATETGTYSVLVEGEVSDWIDIAPKTLDLVEGECKNVYLFVTPICYANAGTYTSQLKILGPETRERNLTINVEQCHTFNYTISPLENTSNPCESNIYNIKVKNTGKFADEFSLTQTGVEDSWVEYPRETFILNPNEEINSILELKTECSTNPGAYNFSLNLSNTKTNASQTKNLIQNINGFASLNLDVQNSINICSEEGGQMSLIIKNESTLEDTINISISNSDFLSIDTSSLTIPAGEVGEATITLAKTDPKDTNFVVTVHSNNYDAEYVERVDVLFEDCYNIGIERKTEQTNYCIGENTQSYAVSNFGTKKADIIISTTGIESDDKIISLDAGTERDISLNFSAVEGQLPVEISVGTDYSQDSVEYTLNFENCYGSELIVPDVAVCANTETERTITLKNNGTKDQTYSLSTNADWIVLPSEVSLNPESETELIMQLNVPENLEGTYTVTAESANAELQRNLNISLLATENCYGFDVEKEKQIVDVNCCSGEIVEILLRNTGEFEQELTLEKIAPEWVSFSEDSVTLAKGEEETIYVYFSPPAGTNGTLIAQILIKNQEEISKTINFDLDVFGGNCGLTLSADLDVNNGVTLTKIFTRKEIDIAFKVKNDSNVGFNILDIDINEFPGADVVFNNGLFLEPGQSLTASTTLSFAENQDPQNMNVHLLIKTSAGDFQKTQYLNLSDSNALIYDEIAITGFLTQFVAPAAGVVLLIIILLAIVLIAGKKPKSKRKIKKK
jgi:hypothetical protein